jgi:hypothetical protein
MSRNDCSSLITYAKEQADSKRWYITGISSTSAACNETSCTIEHNFTKHESVAHHGVNSGVRWESCSIGETLVPTKSG